MNPAQAKTPLGKDLLILAQVIESVREAIASTGSAGIPSGHLYSMLMGFGCSFDVYTHLISALKETGKITEKNNVLRSV